MEPNMQELFALDALKATTQMVQESPLCSATPLIRHLELEKDLGLEGVQLYLKCENMQQTGSFKMRGVVAQMAGLPDDARRGERHLVTMSAGNYGKAFAHYLAKEKLRGTVLMPKDAPSNRVDIIRGYGVEVRQMDKSAMEGECQRMVREEGAIYMHPFDDPRLISGYGSVGLEIISDLPSAPDAVLVCCGGGGILAGTAAAIRAAGLSTCRMYGVEPTTANSMSESFRLGSPAQLPASSSIAGGLAPPYAGTITYSLCKQHVDDILLVTDEEILTTTKLMYSRGLVVEPSGAAALSALQHARLPGGVRGTVVVVLTGGNVSPEDMAKYWRKE